MLLVRLVDLRDHEDELLDRALPEKPEEKVLLGLPIGGPRLRQEQDGVHPLDGTLRKVDAEALRVVETWRVDEDDALLQDRRGRLDLD
jgi:hypothetical protein